MKTSRFYWGMVLFAFSAFLVGQAAPEGCISFSQITGQATDDQIPDNITIDHSGTADSASYASTAGDADTLDGLHANQLQDSDDHVSTADSADTLDGYNSSDFLGNSPYLIDAEGTELGLYLGKSGSNNYYFDSESERRLTINMQTGDLVADLGFQNSFYTTTNCAGTPYAEALSADPYDLVRLEPWTDRFYFYSNGIQNVLIRSRRYFSDCAGRNEYMNVAPLTQISIPDYVGPLRIEMR